MASSSSVPPSLFSRKHPEQFSDALLRLKTEMRKNYTDHFITYRGNELSLLGLSSMINGGTVVSGSASSSAAPIKKDIEEIKKEKEKHTEELKTKNLSLFIPDENRIKDLGRKKDFYLAELSNIALEIIMKYIDPSDLRFYENEINEGKPEVLWKSIYDSFHRINESTINEIKNTIEGLKYDSSVGVEKFTKDLRYYADYIRRLNSAAYTYYEELNYVINKLKIEKYFKTKIMELMLSQDYNKYSQQFIDKFYQELIDIEKVQKEIDEACSELEKKDINVALTMNKNNHHNNNQSFFNNNHWGRGRGGRVGFHRGGRGGYQNNFNNNNNNNFNNNNYNYHNNNGYSYRRRSARGRGGRGRGRGGYQHNQFNNNYNNNNHNNNSIRNNNNTNNNNNGIPDPLHQHQIENGLCFKCGKGGHRANQCPSIVGYLDSLSNSIIPSAVLSSHEVKKPNVIDTGTDLHVFGDERKMHRLGSSNCEMKITSATGNSISITQKGEVELKQSSNKEGLILLKDVHYDSRCPANLISAARLTDRGCCWIIDNNSMRLIRGKIIIEGETVLEGKRIGNHYLVDDNQFVINNNKTLAINAVANPSIIPEQKEIKNDQPSSNSNDKNDDNNTILEADGDKLKQALLWHKKYNHISFQKLRIMANDKSFSVLEFMKGISSKQLNEIQCDGCLIGKLQRHPFRKYTNAPPVTGPLDRLYFDTSGRIRLPDDKIKRTLFKLFGSVEYAAAVVDSYTSKVFGKAIKTKDEATVWLRVLLLECMIVLSLSVLCCVSAKCC